MTKLSPTKPIHQPTTRNQLMYVAAIVTLAIAILTIIGFITFTVLQNNRQQATLDQTAAQTNELVKQVKNLSEQNKKLSQTSVNYAYCNAVLLSRYTQTLSPITIQDLEKCILLSFPEGTGPVTSTNNQDVIAQVAPNRTQASNTPSQGSVTPPNNNNGTGSTTNPNNGSTGGTTTMNGLNLTIPSLLGLPETKIGACVNVLGIKTC